MHITLYHDAVIPPLHYGGTERLIYLMMKALHSLGHSVTLIARPGSLMENDGIEVITCRHSNEWKNLVPKKTDLIHLWATPSLIPQKPFLVTIGGNGRAGELFHPNTVFVSRKHAEQHGSSYFVHNGIDPNNYVCDDEREDYVVFLAKASWKVKNLKGARSIAREARVPLHVLGSRNWPLGLNQLSQFIPGPTYHGMVGDLDKQKVLRKAKALLFPVRWHEPFGLAITEALASGCPVLGTPYGSLPEIITPEVGVLSARKADLIQALLTKTFSPQKCRARVYEGLTHLDMARSYLRLYDELLSHGSLRQKAGEIYFRPSQPAETLLPWDES